MQVLMIGMDGVKAETFDRGWTPFIKSLIEKGNKLELKEDLVSRGWAEIILGQHASVTKALYEGPLADGTHTWSDKYKLSDTPGLGDTVKPIWQALNEKGYKVGIMNVPTTFPAPKVDGFFVSGGGGGGPINQDISIEQCFPPNIKTDLENSSYVVDLRLPNLLGEKKLYKPKEFYAELNLMNENRTTSFINLSNTYNVEFGFIVYKSSIVTTETLFLPELQRAEKEGVRSCFYNATKTFYQDFDKQIERLVKAFPTAKLILVSDHSMAVREYSVNANAFLAQIGMQEMSNYRSTTYSFIKSFKKFVPGAIRNKLKKSPKINSSYMSMTPFDVKTSQAFSLSFSNGQHGIYINDCNRFDGPVSVDKIEEYKDKIVNKFNSHKDSIYYNLKAYKTEESVIQFPDVILDLPDGFLTSCTNKEFVSSYVLNAKTHDLKESVKGHYHTIKAHHPMAINCSSDWSVLPDSDKMDLRLIYDHILNEFSNT